MDVVFTLAVWIVLLTLVGHGLRLAQLRADEAHAAEVAEPMTLPSVHPVTASADRVLAGAGSRR
jgi:hypothetical protein